MPTRTSAAMTRTGRAARTSSSSRYLPPSRPAPLSLPCRSPTAIATQTTPSSLARLHPGDAWSPSAGSTRTMIQWPKPPAASRWGRAASSSTLGPRRSPWTTAQYARSAFAHDLRLPVLIHAGRGIPALGRHSLALAAEFPDSRVILAHAAVSDVSWIWRHLPGRPNLFIDTSWWNPVDLVTLFAYAPGPGSLRERRSLWRAGHERGPRSPLRDPGGALSRPAQG